MKKQEEKDAYTLAVMHKTLSGVDNLDWQEINQILVETAKEVFGETSGKGTYIQRKKLGGGKKKLGKQWP